MIRFLNPEILWLLALLPLIALWRGRKGRVAAVEYSNVEIARTVARETRSRPARWTTMLRLLVATLLILGLARPQYGQGRSEVQASGVDLMLAVDVSGSMEALDFTLDGQPANRLECVKSVVSKFIEARPNDRIGLVAFAGAPYLVSPLSLDHQWLQQNLDRVRIGLIEDGTAIGSALATSVNRLRDQPSKSKIVVLLTDGLNNAGKVAPQTAAEAAKAMGVKVYTIGAGAQGEAPVPVKDQFGNQRIVMAKVDVDEAALKKIADETGGKFFRATDTDSLKKIYAEIDRMEKTTHAVKKFSKYHELFALAVVPGLMLLGLTLGLEQTRFRRLPGV
ncbi:MAG: VWA domain-containing protein [Verrucomicrobiota bacterium]|nr:VWA domain-containing protein [Verrucomicrobiota bacterium]MCC6821431.1 VWA domain-containing protein [Limisphaerales bacterium]